MALKSWIGVFVPSVMMLGCDLTRGRAFMGTQTDPDSCIQDPECASMDLIPCQDSDKVTVHYFYCDPCGAVWFCSQRTSHDLRSVWGPSDYDCSCVNENGNIDSGAPGCQSYEE